MVYRFGFTEGLHWRCVLVGYFDCGRMFVLLFLLLEFCVGVWVAR